MTERQTLTPADELAGTNPVSFPNESAQYRQARNALLAERVTAGR